MKEIIEFMNNILNKPDGSLSLLGKSLKIIFIFIIINIVVIIISKIIDRTMKDKRISQLYSNDRRANTLGLILKKIVKYFLFFIWIVMSLELFDINTGSILATAGIGGLAIGFAAQSLVKDIITGFFIILEDQYAVGDYIKINTLEGMVEELGLRVTKLRDLSGELHIIPNSNIQIVTNKNRGAMRALVKVSVAYEENIDRVLKSLEALCLDIKNSNESIVEGPTILGITDFGDSAISITIVANTKAMEQWSVERDIRKRIKEQFDKEDIEIPYPKRVIIGGK